MCTHNAILSKPPTRGQLHCCYVKVMQLFTTVALWSLMSGPCLEKTRASNDWDVYLTGPSMSVYKTSTRFIDSTQIVHMSLLGWRVLHSRIILQYYLSEINVFTLEGAFHFGPLSALLSSPRHWPFISKGRVSITMFSFRNIRR